MLQKKRTTRSEKGFSLVTVMIIMLVVGLLIAGMFSMALPSVRGVMLTKTQTALRAGAESTLDYVVNSIAAGDNAYIPGAGQSKSVTIPQSIINAAGSYGMPISSSAVVSNITCPQSSYLYNALMDPANQAAGVGSNGWISVTATAATGQKTHRLRAIMKPIYTVTNAPPQSTPFNVSTNGISLRGNFSGNGGITVNSYNSTTDPNANTIKHNGDVRVNGNVSTNGASGTIDGDATASGTVTGGATVTGVVTQQADPMTFPPPPAAPASAIPRAPITGNSNTVLAPGDYVITADNAPAISLSGQRTLTISGMTRIWIKGTSPTIALNGGGLVNSTQAPANFQIFYTPSNPAVTEASATPMIDIGGSSAFKGVVYAPNANVKLRGTSGYYGAIFANGMTLAGGGNGQDGAFHFDEALQNFNLFNWLPPSSNTQRTYQRSQCVSWEELD